MSYKPTGSDSLDTPIWGALAIGQVINRGERETRHLIENELIDVSKVGERFVSTPRRLLASVGVRFEAAE